MYEKNSNFYDEIVNMFGEGTWRVSVCEINAVEKILKYSVPLNESQLF